MEVACSSRVSVSVNKTTRCHNTEAHNVCSKILASLSLTEVLSLPINFQHLFPCTHVHQTFKLIQQENKQISLYYHVVLHFSLLPLPPHMFADTSIYHQDYHSSRTSICKWLYVTDQALP
jgi:hypothetical protein